ncbi:MAG: hypothetical protein O2967_18710 [Proteobacteria bacterium]|nr:hypothetical protein [Pseudomonadota bacterium]
MLKPLSIRLIVFRTTWQKFIGLFVHSRVCGICPMSMASIDELAEIVDLAVPGFDIELLGILDFDAANAGFAIC